MQGNYAPSFIRTKFQSTHPRSGGSKARWARVATLSIIETRTEEVAANLRAPVLTSGREAERQEPSNSGLTQRRQRALRHILDKQLGSSPWACNEQEEAMSAIASSCSSWLTGAHSGVLGNFVSSTLATIRLWRRRTYPPLGREGHCCKRSAK